MINLEQLSSFFPPFMRENAVFKKYMLKEYLQLMILDYLSATPYIRKITFIGGTCLRLVKGIDRFSEDMDFDCKNLTEDEFKEMTDAVIRFLIRSGYNAKAKEKSSSRLRAFRCNIYFPELLFDMELSGHKDERFLIKIDAQDQGIAYQPKLTNIKGCGYFFPFPVPSDEVLCSMKTAAMLARSKGRDFYDLMFLLAQANPDYTFLSERSGIKNLHQLKEATRALLKIIDLKQKQRDFEHLLFNKNKSEKILLFWDFISSLTG
jgi:predicted nucleotidyltransferase component of viral defense system